MTLAPGARLGPYEILAPLGAEAMRGKTYAYNGVCKLSQLYLIRGLK